MIESIKLNKVIKKQGQECNGIIKFELKYYDIYVYEGTISKFDIIVQYKNENLKRERTPKHIHWVVDLLLKIQGKKCLANKFLTEIQSYWDKCLPLTNNDFETLKNLVENDYKSFKLNKYKKLNKFGQYDIEFLYVLFVLLIHQEKTNYNQAYMFKSVIDKLLEQKLDIYSVVAVATHGGR